MAVKFDLSTADITVISGQAVPQLSLAETCPEGRRAVFNLTKELRDRVDQLLQKPIDLSELLVDELSARDKAFAYVAASWMSGIDGDVDAKEEALLARLAALLELSDTRRNELARIARDLEPLRKDKQSWATEVVAFFKAIPSRLEGGAADSFEVAFE